MHSKSTCSSISHIRNHFSPSPIKKKKKKSIKAKKKKIDQEQKGSITRKKKPWQIKFLESLCPSALHKRSLPTHKAILDRCIKINPAFPLRTHSMLLETLFNVYFIPLCIILRKCLSPPSELYFLE